MALEYAEKALQLESDETQHLPFYLNSYACLDFSFLVWVGKMLTCLPSCDSRTDDDGRRSDTYLNQCAILSELGRCGVNLYFFSPAS